MSNANYLALRTSGARKENGMAKLGQINTGVQSFDDMLRQKVAEDIKTGQEIKENKTHTSSSGNTHGGGGKSVPSGGGGNSKGASNQAKTTAGRSRDSSPAPKPASTNPRATKKETEADVKAVITDFLQKKSNPGQSAAAMGRPTASAYRTEALKTSYKDSLSKGVTTPAKTDEEKNARGRVIFDALSPRSAERAKAGQLGASKQKNYFSDVSEYGVKKANDMAEKRTRNITNAISNSKDKVNVTEQQHIRRLANEDGEEWENYKAIQKQKEAGQNERATYLIDTYHLRGDTKKVAEYNRIYNTEGIDKANEYALMNSGYIDLSRYTGEDREAALKADIDRYYADGQSGILGDENFMWEFEKQNMNELDRRYYDKRDSVFNGYAQMMAKDPEAEKKISEGMGYINKQIDEATYENAHARETGNYMAVDNDIMYSAMNDEQKRLWAYVSSISKSDEKKYLDSIAYRLDKQYNQNVADSIKNLPAPVAITADLLSSAFAQVPATSASFVNISNQAARELKGAEYMPSDALAQRNFGANMLGSLNSEALGRIDNDIIRELYSMGSSLVQNVAGMAVYQEFYPYIMALSAAGGTAQNTLQRGNSKNKAVINGAAVGAIEYFMEKAGFERYMEAILKPGASTSKFIGFSKAVLSNTGSEALEEGVGAFAQGMVDLAICGDLSELNITKNMYMEKYRLSENDAQLSALFDCFVKEPFMNALSGAFTGGIIGGASHTLGLAREGVSFVESNIGDAALVTALKANPSTNTRQIADKILGNLSDGKRVSALDYGNLKSAMQSENIRVDGKKAAKAMEQTSGTPEILYKKNGGGVAGTVAASRLSGIQYSFLDTLGKARGINFVVADYLGKNTGDGYVTDAANGLTSSRDPNTIFLSANSERPILAVAKHELVHMLKGTKSGAEYIDSIGKTLKNADSEAFETAIENIIDRHAAYGEVISRKAAIEELAADSAWKSVGKYSEVARLAEENPKLLKKVYNMIVDLAGTVSGAYKDTGNFAEGLMDKMTEQELRSAKEMMGRALGETGTAFEAGKIKDKFDLKEPVESKKNLIAVHNISAEKLTKALELGGFPMPSIAVTKPELGFSDFGNISVLFNKNTIDPNNDIMNKVYSGDAYTPTFPTVEYKVNQKKISKIHDLYYDLSRKYGYDITRPLYSYVDEGNASDKLNMLGGEEGVISQIKDDTGMMQLFFLTKGEQTVAPVETEIVEEITPSQKKQFDYLISKLGKEFFEKSKTPEGKPPLKHKREFFAKNGDEFKNAFGNMFAELYGFSDTEIENILNNNNLQSYCNIIADCRKYIDNGAKTIKTVTDRSATDKAIKDKAESLNYEKWVDDTFRGLVEKKGIYNNKDPYTRSGNRKSFEQLHYDYNLDNVVRAMNDSGEKGLGAFGVRTILGAATKTYDSIDDIKSDAEKRMKRMSDDEYDDIRQKFVDRLYNISKEALNNSNSSAGVDSVADVLSEAVSKYKTKSEISNFIKRELSGWASYSDIMVDELMQLVSDIQQMPVTYFEAKPQRAVGFDEVVAVVMPNRPSYNENLSELRGMLDERSIPVIEYEYGSNEARAEALNSVDDVKFSLKAPPQNFADMTDSEIEELELQSRGKAYGSKSGKNGLSDAEVRRSKFEAQEDMDVDYLKRENTTLRIMFDRLSKSVRSVTEGKLKLDSKALVNTVSKIISENQSKVSTKTIAPIVAQAYSYINEIATNSKLSEKDSNTLGDRTDRLLIKAAKKIVDGGQTFDRTLFNETKEMRDYIRSTKIRIPKNFDSKKINDFRKENRGRITLVKEGGTPIDSFYGELSSLFPDYFDESVVINESDQLLHIASVLEAVRPVPAELSTAEYENAVKDVAVQLSAAFTDVIFDTKARVNIVAQIEAETREKFRDYYSKAVKKETDKYAEKRKKLEKYYREKNEAIKERAKERKERSETLDTLQSLLKRVRKLRTTDPDARNKLNAVLAEVANLYDGAKGKPRVMAEDTLIKMFGDDYKNVLEHMSEDEKLEYAMKELEGGKQFISIDAIKRYYYDAVASDPNHVENNFLRRKFEAAEMTGLNEISIENAKDIIEILTAVETEVKNANKILDSEIKATVASAAHETMNQLKRIKGNKGSGRISSFITGHLTPVSALRKFVGYQKDNKLVKLAEEINKGERTKDAVVQKCMQLFDGFISQKESKKFLESLDDVIKIAGVEMTKGMRLSICMYSRNKQSAEHIHGGGITIPDLKLLKKGDKAAAYAKGRTVQISQEMQLEIASSLTEQEKAFLDSIEGVMNYIASEINKVSLQLYGVETANVKNYFPILTDKSFIGKDINAFDQVGGVENAGFMKERRPGAYTPIVLDNVMAVTMSHINAASKVIGLSIPMRNFKMVYNSVSYAPVFDFEGPVKDTSYGSVVNALKKTWGTEATDYIENFIKDIEVGRKEDKDYAKFLDKRFSALARSALLMNLSVVMKQVAAYPISAAELGHIALIKGAFHRITEADKALYDSLTPVIWKRKQGYGMADFADYANGPSIEQKLPALLGWIQKSDVATAYKICKACEMYVNSNYNYEKNSKEWKNKLAETINRAIERTQQGSNVSQRAAVLRSPNSLVHALNMFKTQTYLQFDLIYDAVGEFNAYKKYVKDGSVTKEDMSRSARKVANVFSAYLMSEIVMSAATAIWRAFAYDKKEWQDENGETTAKSILKFVGKTTILDGFGMLMFGNEISDLLYSIFTGDKYYGIDVSPVVLISDFGESLYKVFDKVQNINDIKKDGNYYTWKDMLKPTADAVEDFATMLGVPAKPAKRLAGGIYRNAFELIEKTPLAKEAETFKLAIEKVFGTPGNYIAERKSAANENYNAITNFENAEAYKRYERGAHVINVLEKYIAQNPDERSDIEYLMDKCIEYFDENNLPSDVAAEAERLYTTLQKLGYGDIASKVIPYTQADAVISFKYGGENFKHMLTAKQYSDYARRVNNANIEAYKELMNDETYKSQDAYTQAKMLDTLRSEKVREVEINIFDEAVGFSDEQRRAEEKSQFNKAKEFTGLPSKKYIKLEDFQFEVTEETYKKYDDYLKVYDKKVKELLNSGVALNSISGFEKVYFKDDNGQKVYIDRPYNDYNETFKSKIDNKIAEIAKGTIENPQTEEQAQITKEIVYSTGNLYAKDQDVMNNINKGDYSKKLWQRKTVDNLRNNIKEQQAAVQSAEQQVQTGRQRVVNIANQYIGVPYEWGGMSPEGFDCSGFVQYVYNQYGISLPRTTAQQPNVGTAVDKSELQPGDLVFFRGSKPHSNGIGHVGIYIGNDQFIHAPSTGDVVKISKLSSRKDYKTARRIIND